MNKNFSVRAIAKFANLSPATIYNRARKLGFEFNGGGFTDKEAQQILTYQNRRRNNLHETLDQEVTRLQRSMRKLGIYQVDESEEEQATVAI